MSDTRIYEFGNFRLDPVARRLFRDGQIVTLTPKVFELLLVLVESRARIVTRQELVDAIWPGTFVEEGNLTQNISVLRKLLSTAGTGKLISRRFHGKATVSARRCANPTACGRKSRRTICRRGS